MKAFLYGMMIQWKIDIRNKDALLLYYAAPLLVYFLMGGVFSSIMEGMEFHLIETMSIFAISMGALLGAGASLCTTYGSDIRKAYQVGNIPLIVPFLQNLISAFLHISIMSSIIIITAPLVFEAQLPSNMPVFLLTLSLYIIVCIIISSALGLWILNTNKMMMGAQCIFLPSILLSGIMMPVEGLNSALQMISNILPANWAYVQLRDCTLYGEYSAALIGCIAIVFLLCLIRLKALSKVN